MNFILDNEKIWQNLVAVQFYMHMLDSAFLYFNAFLKDGMHLN